MIQGITSNQKKQDESIIEKIELDNYCPKTTKFQNQSVDENFLFSSQSIYQYFAKDFKCGAYV